MSKLLPCPFCGGEAEYYTYEQEHDLYDSNTLGFLETYETTEHCVGCEECLAMVGPFVTKKQAIKSWNTRAERTITPVLDDHDWPVWRCPDCGQPINRADRYCSSCGAKIKVVE